MRGRSVLVGLLAATTIALAAPTSGAAPVAAPAEGPAPVVSVRQLWRWLGLVGIDSPLELAGQVRDAAPPLAVCVSGGGQAPRCGAADPRVPPPPPPPAPEPAPAPAEEPSPAASPEPTGEPEPTEAPEPSEDPGPEPTEEPDPGGQTPPAPAPAPVPAPPPASSVDESVEARILELVNRDRVAAGLPALAADAGLRAGARDWSDAMAAAGELTHDDLVIPDGARTAGENVAMRTSGGDVGALLHQQFMNSPGHRANVLSGDFTLIGIGVTTTRDATWVTQRFAG